MEIENTTTPTTTDSKTNYEKQKHLVGCFLEVVYPGKGTVKGLVTGFYKETETLAIDYLYNNSVKLKADSGHIEGLMFKSQKHMCRCELHVKGQIQNSKTAMEYLDARFKQYKRRKGKVGYMLGKVIKSDWGDDGVFLGVISEYAKGSRFRVVYMDGDDEWGVFKQENEFRVFLLEDGGERQIQWFDLNFEELRAAGESLKPRKKNLARSAILNKPVDVMHTKKEEKKESSSGAFTSAFLQTSGIEEMPLSDIEDKDSEHEEKPIVQSPKTLVDSKESEEVEVKTKKIIKKNKSGIGKRSHAQVEGITKQKLSAIKRPKRKNQTEAPLGSELSGEQKPQETKNPLLDSPKESLLDHQINSNMDNPPAVQGKQEGGEKSELQSSLDVDIKDKESFQLSSFFTPVKEKADKMEIEPPALDLPKDSHPGKSLVDKTEALCLEDGKPTALSQEHGIEDSRSTSGSVGTTLMKTSPRKLSPLSSSKKSVYSSVEIGLEMQNLNSELQNLTQSKEKIVNATKTAVTVAQYGGAKRVINSLFDQIKEPVGEERKISLFYLFDSILQWSAKDKVRNEMGKGTGETVLFLELVQERLDEIVDSLSDDYECYKKLRRVLLLWKERKVLSVESLDAALNKVETFRDQHSRSIEDDEFREQGKTVLYVKRPSGPECSRMVLSSIFGSMGTLPDSMEAPPSLHNLTIRTFERKHWSQLDQEINKLRCVNHFSSNYFHPQIGQVPMERPQEFEDGFQPPLPQYPPPPVDVEDPCFIPPLPPGSPPDDDPNFIPPLPSSPPPTIPRPDLQMKHPKRGNGEFRPSPVFSCSRQKASTHHYRQHDREFPIHPPLPPRGRNSYPPSSSELWKSGFRNPPPYYPEVYPNRPALPPSNPPPPVQSLPPHLVNQGYHYHQSQWTSHRPGPGQRNYPMWNQQGQW